jgi:hypothetical protein
LSPFFFRRCLYGCRISLYEERRLKYLRDLSKRFKLAPAYPFSKTPIGNDWNNPGKIKDYNDNDFLNKNAVILTGKVSDVFVLDIDHVELFNYSAKKYGWTSPKTFTVKTGNGFHYYFNYPNDGRGYRKKSKKVLGIDLIGDGGCVVSPYSYHPDTKQPYHVIEPMLPVDAPQWLIDLYWDDRPEWKNVNIKNAKRIPSEIKSLIENGTETGKRSEAMMSVINSLIANQYSDEQLFSIFYTERIGQKFMSVGATKNEWLEKQINKARKFVSENQSSLELYESDKDTYYNTILKNINVNFGRKFIDSAPPTTDPIIEGILPIGGQTVLIGPTGVGKSIFTLNLSMWAGISPANGFFGMLKVPKPVKSVFLQSENDQYTLWQRVIKITSADPEMKDGYRNVYIPSYAGRARLIGFDFRSEYFRKLMVTLKTKTGADIAIIDPAISFLGCDENSNTEIRSSLDSLTKVATELSISVLLVHHPGKVGITNVYTGRGASALADWSTNLITLSPVQLSNVNCIKLTVQKSRTSSSIDPFHIIMNDDLIFEKYNPHGNLIDTILEVLMQNGGKFSTQSNFLDAIKMYDDSISIAGAKKAIQEAANQGLINIIAGTKNSKSFSIV